MDKAFAPLLKKSGYKITKPRLLVLGLLHTSKHPLSVKEILKKMKGEKVDQVTIYRTLETLKRSGIITQIDFQDDAAYFELKDTKKDHHHIICTNCRKIEDFAGLEHGKLIKKVLKNAPNFAKITNHSFELFGICKSCA